MSDLDPTELDAADDVEGVDPEPEAKNTRTVVERFRSGAQGVASSPARLGIAVCTAVILALSALALWFGFHAYQGYQAGRERAAFLAVGRQGALDLTTADYTHVEADVARVLGISAGAFHDEFQARSGPFSEEMRRTKSKSVGAIAEAGVESADEKSAQVLVAVKVTTTREGVAEPRLKGWRMRIGVERVGADIKVTSVVFVP